MTKTKQAGEFIECRPGTKWEDFVAQLPQDIPGAGNVLRIYTQGRVRHAYMGFLSGSVLWWGEPTSKAHAVYKTSELRWVSSVDEVEEDLTAVTKGREESTIENLRMARDRLEEKLAKTNKALTQSRKNAATLANDLYKARGAESDLRSESALRVRLEKSVESLTARNKALTKAAGYSPELISALEDKVTDYKQRWEAAEKENDSLRQGPWQGATKDLQRALASEGVARGLVLQDLVDLQQRYDFLNQELRKANLKLKERSTVDNETETKITEAFEGVDERLRKLEVQPVVPDEPQWACHKQVLRGDQQKDSPVFQGISKNLVAADKDFFRHSAFLTILLAVGVFLVSAGFGLSPGQALASSVIPVVTVLGLWSSTRLQRAYAYQRRIDRVMGDAMHYDGILFQATPISPPEAASPEDNVRVGDDGNVYVRDEEGGWVRMPKQFMDKLSQARETTFAVHGEELSCDDDTEVGPSETMSFTAAHKAIADAATAQPFTVKVAEGTLVRERKYEQDKYFLDVQPITKEEYEALLGPLELADPIPTAEAQGQPDLDHPTMKW